jgi:hypothetical protein
LANVVQDPSEASQFIDNQDLEALKKDPKALASLLQSDPAWKKSIRWGGELKSGRKEIPAHDGLDQAQVAPVAYKRVMTYVKLAYSLIDPSSKLAINGVYDVGTQKTTDKFQKMLGIKEGTQGNTISSLSLGGLICYLQKDTTLSDLEKMSREISKGGQYLEKLTKEQKMIMLRSFQLLYPNEVNPRHEIWGEKSLDEISKALATHFDGAALIGPNVLGQIRDKIKVLVPRLS